MSGKDLSSAGAGHEELTEEALRGQLTGLFYAHIPTAKEHAAIIDQAVGFLIPFYAAKQPGIAPARYQPTGNQTAAKQLRKLARNAKDPGPVINTLSQTAIVALAASGVLILNQPWTALSELVVARVKKAAKGLDASKAGQIKFVRPARVRLEAAASIAAWAYFQASGHQKIKNTRPKLVHSRLKKRRAGFRATEPPLHRGPIRAKTYGSYKRLMERVFKTLGLGQHEHYANQAADRANASIAAGKKGGAK